MSTLRFLIAKRCPALLLALVLVVQVGSASGGGSDSIRYYVYYELRHIHTTTAPEDTLENEMLLAVGTGSSYFVSYDKFRLGSDLHKRITEEQERTALTGVPFSIQTKFHRCYLPEHILFHSRRQHIVVEQLLQAYWYEAPFPEPDWRLTDESKEILGLVCQKATVDFRGREWIVWFAPEIPLPVGPWLLHGLPGLILEARDVSGEVSFTATSVVDAPDVEKDYAFELYMPDAVKPPGDGFVKIRQNDFVKMKMAAKANWVSFIQSRADYTGFFLTPRDYFGRLVQREFNEDNPIDLENRL